MRMIKTTPPIPLPLPVENHLPKSATAIREPPTPRVKMKLRFLKILMAETFLKVILEVLEKKNIDWPVFLECDDVIMTSSLLFTKLNHEMITFNGFSSI